jgi:acyl carrier protein phosphodiesterase
LIALLANIPPYWVLQAKMSAPIVLLVKYQHCLVRKMWTNVPNVVLVRLVKTKDQQVVLLAQVVTQV